MTAPAPVARAVECIVGTPPVSWRPSTSGGHTRALRWYVELASGARVFAKATADPPLVVGLEHEARIYASVSGSFLPSAIGSGREGDWSVLVLEDIQHARWPPPYPDDVSPLFGALDELAATSAPEWAPDALDDVPASPWEQLEADPQPLVELGACSAQWIASAVTTLAAAARAADFGGDRLLHRDIWSGNVCFVNGRALLIDWAAAVRGNHSFDVASALFDLRFEGRRPPAVALPDEAAWAAYLAGHFARRATAPLAEWIVGATSLRRRWRRAAGVALEWAAERLDLPQPR